jgi:hypothetical protein
MVWAEVGWVGIGWIVEAAQVVTIEMSGAFLLTKVLLVDFHWRSRQGKTKAQHRSALFSPLMTFLGNPAHNWESGRRHLSNQPMMRALVIGDQELKG